MSCPLPSRSIVSADALNTDLSASIGVNGVDDDVNASLGTVVRKFSNTDARRCKDFICYQLLSRDEHEEARVKSMRFCGSRIHGETVRMSMNQNAKGDVSGSVAGVYTCGSPKCPSCEWIYRLRTKQDVLDGFREVLRQNQNRSKEDKLIPMMFTLTASHRDTDVAGFMQSFKNAISKFRQHTAYREWKYYFSSYEATLHKISNGLHLHQHMIILIPQKDVDDLHQKCMRAWKHRLDKVGLSCNGVGLVITETNAERSLDDLIGYALKDNYSSMSIEKVTDEVIANPFSKLGYGVPIERVISYLAGVYEEPRLEQIAGDALLREFVKAYYLNIGNKYQKSNALSRVIRSLSGGSSASGDGDDVDPSFKRLVSVVVNSDGWSFLQMKSWSKDYDFDLSQLDFWRTEPDLNRLITILERELTTSKGEMYHYDVFFEKNEASQKCRNDYILNQKQELGLLAA